MNKTTNKNNTQKDIQCSMYEKKKLRADQEEKQDRETERSQEKRARQIRWNLGEKT